MRIDTIEIKVRRLAGPTINGIDKYEYEYSEPVAYTSQQGTVSHRCKDGLRVLMDTIISKLERV